MSSRREHLTSSGRGAILLPVHSPFPTGLWASLPSSGKDPSALKTPISNSVLAGPPLPFAWPGAGKQVEACSPPLVFHTPAPSCIARGIMHVNVDTPVCVSKLSPPPHPSITVVTLVA